MKGKITSFGNLQIERAGLFKQQYCPSVNEKDGSPSCCGDWCPHFEEPYIKGDDLFIRKHDMRFKLEICQEKQFLFHGFVDERPKPKKTEDQNQKGD